MKKYIYFFGAGKAEGKAAMKALLGGKGANLAEMANVGLPVPPGFTISTDACEYYSSRGHKYPAGMLAQVRKNQARLEKLMGKKLGAAQDPLLVSIRSGSAVSMPGMMDTVLNLGMNDRSVLGFIEKTGNARAGWDSYRRFIDMFGNVVMGPSTGLAHEDFEVELSRIKKKYKAKDDTDLTASQLKELVERYKKVYLKHVKKPFPQDPMKQLKLSINAVFGSWDSDRAVKYRQINKITGLKGTAVNVQTMVFGNMGDSSGTGVGFTRNPANGDRKPMGEYLINAQGEDVVAGIRTPSAIVEMPKEKNPVWKRIYRELMAIMKKLENHYRDMQDIEFTVQEGKLFMLQTRTGKRTGLAAIKMACDMVRTGLITPRQAISRIEGDHMAQLLFPIFDPKAEAAVIKKGLDKAYGLPAGPGAATGRVVFTAEAAEKIFNRDPTACLILVRQETSPEDVGGMWAAQGILTSTGGMTSHAAVVARGWGKCCVAGAGTVNIDDRKKQFMIGKVLVREGQYISLNGTTGAIYCDNRRDVDIPTTSSPIVAAVVDGVGWARKHPIYKMYRRVSNWADEFRKMGVRTNADTPPDAVAARAFGAEGIGLCRTEHMFFESDRIMAVREFILAEDEKARRKAIGKLLPYQRKDFEGIFKAMDGLPVTIRLLDPPLHEFVPHQAKEQRELAKVLGISPKKVAERITALHEMNPMLGHRGCRLSISYPELCVMQTRAIIEAACVVAKKGIMVRPEIMVPLIGTSAEFDYLEEIIRATADEIIEKRGAKITYLVGTMIEIPRACLVADKIAQKAQFFSFGTNDLTQMTFGYSRDDAGVFLPDYLEKKILPGDPFEALDQEGVGALVEIAIERGRSTRPDLKVGICGEHGGEPGSVKFCYRVGMNYVSCSPFRVPIARLAAAQAAIEEG
ncbi:MAG: pyruvate, phosphate dikinase [Candidatus Euphemobacter frigidus]|nr:pyruvate, phosphate dikinase [Candidatus Euphemobacter frigidus]MDP8274941.1 pyruvate, phosphate dikinase [Candidatus Euphemobacter frigidus]